MACKHMERLVEAVLVCSGPQAVLESVAMAVPKTTNYRLVTDYRAVNNMIEPAAMPVLNRTN